MIKEFSFHLISILEHYIDHAVQMVFLYPYPSKSDKH